MPQMANDALSENWLFKELGDMHWDLLSRGFNKSSTELVDYSGKRLFPTFVRIKIETDPLKHFIENANLKFEGEISRYGNSTCLSVINGQSRNRKIKATLMTIFSTRGMNGNSKLNRSHPYMMENDISEDTIMPDFLSEYRVLKKGKTKNVYINNVEFFVFDFFLHETEYLMNPYYDLNGVGLLYVASYPVISDKCETDFFNQTHEESWETQYHTIARDIFYFSNCDRTDTIIYRLHYFETLENGNVKIASSLYRKSDMTLLSKIFTIKSKATHQNLNTCKQECSCNKPCKKMMAF